MSFYSSPLCSVFSHLMLHVSLIFEFIIPLVICYLLVYLSSIILLIISFVYLYRSVYASSICVAPFLVSSSSHPGVTRTPTPGWFALSSVVTVQLSLFFLFPSGMLLSVILFGYVLSPLVFLLFVLSPPFLSFSFSLMVSLSLSSIYRHSILFFSIIVQLVSLKFLMFLHSKSYPGT